MGWVVGSRGRSSRGVLGVGAGGEMGGRRKKRERAVILEMRTEREPEREGSP